MREGFRAKKPSVDQPDPTNSVSDRHRMQTDTQSMQSALSVVRGNECQILVNKKNAVQFCGSDARYLAVGNYSCCTEHRGLHSTGTEVALIPRYTLATTLSIGNDD